MKYTLIKIAIAALFALCLCGCSTEEKAACSECRDYFPEEQLAYSSMEYICMKCYLAEGYTLCENCHIAYVPGYDGGAAGYCDRCMGDFTEPCLMCETYFKSEEMQLSL